MGAEEKERGADRGKRKKEKGKIRKEGALTLVAEMSQRRHLLTGTGLQAGFSRSHVSECVRERSSL